MKKLFICITKSNWGGAQKYVFDLATNLPKDKFDISVLLGGSGELKDRLEKAGIRVIMLKNSQRDINMFKVFMLGFTLIRIFWNERPDIVHLNSSQMGGSGGLAARLTGIKKIIFTGHGWAFNEDRPKWQKTFAKFFHILTIILSHKTIAVSEITKNQIPKLFRKKITVIYNGIRPIEFLEKEESRKFLLPNVRGEVSWIGTISELHKNKGLKYAIEAISKIKQNIIFVVIGEGEERKNLENLIEGLDLKNKVFLLGRIPMASGYLKAFDIVTLTSITEALPYFLIEAGFAELPVLASNVGGIPEIIKDGETGILVDSKNPLLIKEKVEFLLENPDKAKDLGEKLRKQVSEKFTIEKMTVDTIKLYS